MAKISPKPKFALFCSLKKVVQKLCAILVYKFDNFEENNITVAEVKH